MTRAELDWNDPDDVRAWLAALEDAALDVISAAEDQGRPMRDRDLGARAARAIVAEGASSIESLIAHARASLPTDHGDPSGSSSPH